MAQGGKLVLAALLIAMTALVVWSPTAPPVSAPSAVVATRGSGDPAGRPSSQPVPSAKGARRSSERPFTMAGQAVGVSARKELRALTRRRPALDGSAPDERDPETSATRAFVTGALIGRVSTRTVFSYSSNGVLESIDVVVPDGSAEHVFNQIVKNARRLPGDDVVFERGQSLARLIRSNAKLAYPGLAPGTARIELLTPSVLEARKRSAADKRAEATVVALAVLGALLLLATFIAYKLISCLSRWLKQARRAPPAQVALASVYTTRSSAAPISGNALSNAKLSASGSENSASSAFGTRLPAAALVAGGLFELDAGIPAAQGPVTDTLDLLLPAPPVVNINGMPMLGGIDGLDIFGNAYGTTINDPPSAADDYREFELQRHYGEAQWGSCAMDFGHGADFGAGADVFGA